MYEASITIPIGFLDQAEIDSDPASFKDFFENPSSPTHTELEAYFQGDRLATAHRLCGQVETIDSAEIQVTLHYIQDEKD